MKLSAEELAAMMDIEEPEGRVVLSLENWERIRVAVNFYNAMLSDEFRIPDLSNATMAFIVDELGATRKTASKMKTYEAILKQRIQIERNGKLVLEGEKFNAEVREECSRTGVDADAVHADHGSKYDKTTYFDQISTKVK